MLGMVILWCYCYHCIYCSSKHVSLIHKYFTNRLIDPTSRKIRYGALLSVDDLLMLRNFCIQIWQEEIIPALEKRITNLTKYVNDSRKGMLEYIFIFIFIYRFVAKYLLEGLL